MIEEMILQMRSLATFDERAAKAAASKLEAAIKSQCAQGVDPSGKAWPAKKKDGGRALVNAANAVRVEVEGDVLEAVVSGPEYFSQTAKPDGALPQRKLIPSIGDPLPPAYQKVLDDSSARTFAQMTGDT